MFAPRGTGNKNPPHGGLCNTPTAIVRGRSHQPFGRSRATPCPLPDINISRGASSRKRAFTFLSVLEGETHECLVDGVNQSAVRLKPVDLLLECLGNNRSCSQLEPEMSPPREGYDVGGRLPDPCSSAGA
jgi:hypothetical protein